MYAIALVPLIFFGLYKNGIDLYKKGYVDLLTSIKPLVILLMAIIGALCGAILREKKKVKLDAVLLNKCKGDVVEAMLVASILPLASSPLIVLLVTFLFSLLFKTLTINRIAIMYIVIEGLNVILGLNTFLNIYELNNVLNYDGLDLFWGLGCGGIFSTSILFIILGLIFLSFNKLYKKEMVYSALFSFLILGVVPYMVMGKYEEIFPLIFGYNILFVLVFIAPNLYSSSYTTKGQILSGILIGIITYLLWKVTPYTAAILAVLIVSVINKIIDRIFVIK